MKLSSKFIKRSNEMCDFDNHVPAPYFRKTFELEFEPEKAEITVTGLGFYELYINGKNVTKGPLAPYITNFHKAIYYDNYDLTNILRKGKNVIALVLGNGFRNSFGGFIWDFDFPEARGPVCTALCIEAENAENKFSLEADESFKTHDSPILYDDLRMGYVYDSRKEIPHWNETDFDDSGWDNAVFETTPAGKRLLSHTDPIAFTGVLKPVSIRHYDSLPFAYESTLADSKPFKETVRNNVYIYDFGEDNSGITVLKINGKPGQKITVRHAEYAPNGLFSITNISFIRPESTEKYLEYSQKDVFICKGGEEVFIPKFKYDGFRYIFVEGLEESQATEDAFEFWTMSSKIEKKATFESSDETLNTLAQMVCRSDVSNFVYYPTDCPQREKNGWTGDISMSAEHMMLWMKAENSLRQWLEECRLLQSPRGAIPCIVPTYTWGVESWGVGPTWDSAIFNVTLEIYRHTGDIGVIKENAQMFLRYLSFVLTMRRDDGTIAYGLGDWLDPYEHINGFIASPLEVTDTVMTMLNAQKAAFMFKQAGLEHEYSYAEGIAAELRKTVRARLIDFDTMSVKGNCQTSQAFGIAAGIFEENEIEKANKRLLELIEANDNENACGMIGLRYIFNVLCDMGEYDLAYKMITSEKRTGYGSFIKNGFTTLPEKFVFDEVTDFGSLNHHFFGDILSVFIQKFAGIRPNPNYDDVNYCVISPSFVSNLKYCGASYDSLFGTVSCRYDRVGEKKIKLMLSVPDNINCVLKLNKSSINGEKEFKLQSGKTEFLIDEE